MNSDSLIIRIEEILDKPLWPILLFAMAFATFLTFIAVCVRFVMGESGFWVEELCRFSFMCMVFVGAGPIVRKKEHIRMELFANMLKGKWAFFHSALINLVLCITCIFIFLWGIKTANISYILEETSDSFVFKIWYVHAMIACGMLLHAVYALLDGLRNVLQLINVKKVN